MVTGLDELLGYLAAANDFAEGLQGKGRPAGTPAAPQPRPSIVDSHRGSVRTLVGYGREYPCAVCGTPLPAGQPNTHDCVPIVVKQGGRRGD